jgi:hypothetical protein
MTTVRWTIPLASLSEAGVERLLSFDGTKHTIYATGDDALLHVRCEGEQIVFEGRSPAPADQMKLHVRYMAVRALGSSEQVSEGDG